MVVVSKNIRFVKGKRTHKYTAILPDGSKVHFGHSSYEHYKDSVPVSQGGGIWSHKNHLDKERRRLYRIRHGNMLCKNGIRCIDIKYSPAWFSYYLLW